jgi:hypothetical protein
VKQSRQLQKHFTQRHKVVEGAKKTEQLFFPSLCALASLREIVFLFAASQKDRNVRSLFDTPRANS